MILVFFSSDFTPFKSIDELAWKLKVNTSIWDFFLENMDKPLIRVCTSMELIFLPIYTPMKALCKLRFEYASSIGYKYFMQMIQCEYIMKWLAILNILKIYKIKFY